MISAVIEKIKVKLTLALPAGTPIILVNEITEQYYLFYLKQYFIYVIKNSDIFTQFFTV